MSVTGNYYNMDVSMHYTDIPYGVYLPTVTFTDSNSNGILTSTMRVEQLNTLGFTGFYEANFDNNLHTLDESAFEDDDKVCVVTINKVQTIKQKCFKNCVNIRAITLDTAVDNNNKYLISSINNAVFYNCQALKQIYIPDTVHTLGTDLFYGCSSLEVAVMGYGIKRNGQNSQIKDRAFMNCTSLKYFVVPDTVTEIGHHSFKNCTTLEHMYLPETITVVGSGADQDPFEGANNNCIYTIPHDCIIPDNKLSSYNNNNDYRIRKYYVIEMNAGGFSLGYVDVRNTVANFITNYNNANGTSLSAGNPVHHGGSGICWKAKIPNGVTIVEDGAFRALYLHENGRPWIQKGLVNIEIAPSVTSWGFAVVHDDNQDFSLIGVYFPKELQFVNTRAFSVSWAGRDTSAIRQIVFESNGRTTNIIKANTNGYATFKDTQSYTLIFPYSFTRGDEAIAMQASNLQLVNIFQKNAASQFTDYGGHHAFQSCHHLTEIHANTFSFNQTAHSPFHDCAYMYRIFLYSNHGSLDPGWDNIWTANSAKRNIFYICGQGQTDISDWQKFGNITDRVYTHLVIKNSVTSIPYSAYYDSVYLRTVIFEHDNNPITNPLDFSYRVFRHSIRINRIYWGNRKFNFSEASYSGDDNAGTFEDCNALRTVYIPKQFTVIPPRMFYDCGITNVVFEKNSSLRTIRRNAFAVNQIGSIDIPASVHMLEWRAFYYNNPLYIIRFVPGSRLKYIDKESLSGWNHHNGPASVFTLPSGVLGIDERAFVNGVKVLYEQTKLVLPSSLEYIDNEAFFTTWVVNFPDEVYFPNSINMTKGPRRNQGCKERGFGTDIFNCHSHSTLYIPQHLNNNTFKNEINSGGNESVNPNYAYYDFVDFIGNNNDIIETLSHNSFYHAEIDDSVKELGNGVDRLVNVDDQLVSIHIPSTVTKINKNAFKDCHRLVYVTFDKYSNCTLIDDNAFENCVRLQDITLPESLITLGANAFKGCADLTGMKIPYGVKNYGSDPFINTKNNLRIVMSDELYNNGFNGSSSYNIFTIPTVRFTESTLTASNIDNKLNELHIIGDYQPVFEESVTHIDPEVLIMHPLIEQVGYNFYKRFACNDNYAYKINTINQPIKYGALISKGTNWGCWLPLYRSLPDTNNWNVTTHDDDNFRANVHGVILMPGYSILASVSFPDIFHTNRWHTDYKHKPEERYKYFENTTNDTKHVLVTRNFYNSNNLPPSTGTVENNVCSLYLFYKGKLII